MCYGVLLVIYLFQNAVSCYHQRQAPTAKTFFSTYRASSRDIDSIKFQYPVPRARHSIEASGLVSVAPTR